MRLSQFDLYAPVLGRKASSEFSSWVRHISALYERCFPGLVVAKAWKVLVECRDVVERTDVIDLLGVFTVQIKADFRSFNRAGEAQRREMALQWLHKGVLRVARKSGWPVQPFEAARKCVVERNYINDWVWHKVKSSRDRKFKAELFCSFGPKRFRAWLRIRDRSGHIVSQKRALNEPPDEFCFALKMGELKWITARRVALIDKDGEQVMELEATGIE